MESPLHWWPKSPAISGMAFYDASRFPAWRHSLFIGALAERNLIRLTLDGDKVVAQERLLGERGKRIRTCGSDRTAMYMADGRIAGRAAAHRAGGDEAMKTYELDRIGRLRFRHRRWRWRWPMCRTRWKTCLT